MATSILEAHDIPFFVHNGGYASLYPGIQIELLNVPTIMVPPSAAEAAKELLGAYCPKSLTICGLLENSPFGTLFVCWWRRCAVSGLFAV